MECAAADIWNIHNDNVPWDRHALPVNRHNQRHKKPRLSHPNIQPKPQLITKLIKQKQIKQVKHSKIYAGNWQIN